MTSPFTYSDLFAGIGGFHAALSAMGGECVYAVEIDEDAARVYEQNWGVSPLGDITEDAGEQGVTGAVGPHDVLAAGFPCQPFSKSGAQRGMEEVRGTLYFNILQVVHRHHPTVVLLENVRNLAGPRHRHEWEVIVRTLRQEGYRVSGTPAVLSPHQLGPEQGGQAILRDPFSCKALTCFLPAIRCFKVMWAAPTCRAVMENNCNVLWPKSGNFPLRPLYCQATVKPASWSGNYKQTPTSNMAESAHQRSPC